MLRVLIVLDIPFYLEGLWHLIERTGEAQVVGAVKSAGDAERLARTECPDVILLDGEALDRQDTMETLRNLEPAPKIVALAIRETPERVLELAESGVVAYVPRHASFNDLMRVLKGVVHDELYCSPHVAATMIRRLALLADPVRAPHNKIDMLSTREREVLELISKGHSNKSIAARLGIAEATAKNHVHNILEKMNLHRRAEAIAAIRGNLRCVRI